MFIIEYISIHSNSNNDVTVISMITTIINTTNKLLHIQWHIINILLL